MRVADVYYGWYVVAAAFTVMLLGFACAYSFTAYFPELQREFDASRASVSLIFSIGGALYFGLGAVSGPLSDRYGPRWVSVFGFTVLGGGLAVAGAAEELSWVYVGFGLGIGVGVGFSYVPAVGAVQPWFLARRGFASGLAVSGIGVGTLVGPLIASVLIDAYGWRFAFVTMGGTALVVGCAAALVLENDPARRGGAPLGERGGRAGPDTSMSLGAALRTRPFWLLYLSAASLSFALFVPFVHLVPYALDHGLSATTGAVVLGLIGIGSTLGRFMVGGVADRIGRLTVLSGCFAGVGVTFFIWLMAMDLWLLGLFALLFGTCYGGFVALAPAVTVDYFGTRSAGAILGVLYSSVGIGTLVGPPFAGYVFDSSGSYSGAILAGEAAAGLAALLSFFLPQPERWRAASA